ncbi:anti-sigma factor [Nakamurella sp. GG22]
MQHPDCDDLALLALDESVGDAVDTHVAECDECAAEVAAFRTTIGLAPLSNYGETAPRPGEHVWQAIAAELELDDQPAAGRLPAQGVGSTDDTTSTTAVPTAGNGNDNGNGNGNGRALRSVPTEPNAGPATTDQPTRRSGGGGEPRRWSRWAAPLAAVVVGIAVGAGAVVIAQNRSSDVTIEAIAPLTPVLDGPLKGEQERQLGQAELVVASSGPQVRVEAPDLPPSSNAYEVWLFGNDGRMVSLGTLSNGSGTFTVPNGISTDEYRTVDVSDEPPNGNPAHSGISLVRGAFS